MTYGDALIIIFGKNGDLQILYIGILIDIIETEEIHPRYPAKFRSGDLRNIFCKSRKIASVRSAHGELENYVILNIILLVVFCLGKRNVIALAPAFSAIVGDDTSKRRGQLS